MAKREGGRQADVWASVVARETWGGWRAVAVASLAANGFLAAGIIAMGAAIVGLTPLKESVPVFVRVATTDDRVLHFEPVRASASTREVITEGLLRSYVLDRETIDLGTEPERFGRMAYLSSPAVARAFRERMTTANPESPYLRYYENNMTRSVSIHRVTEFAGNVWQVEFTTIDYEREREASRRSWIATIHIEFVETQIRYEDRFLNPWGMQVTQYRVGERT